MFVGVRVILVNKVFGLVVIGLMVRNYIVVFYIVVSF